MTVADAELRAAETHEKASAVAATDAASRLAKPIDADGSTQRTAVASSEEPLSPRAEALSGAPLGIALSNATDLVIGW